VKDAGRRHALRGGPRRAKAEPIRPPRLCQGGMTNKDAGSSSRRALSRSYRLRVSARDQSPKGRDRSPTCINRCFNRLRGWGLGFTRARRPAQRAGRAPNIQSTRALIPKNLSLLYKKPWFIKIFYVTSRVSWTPFDEHRKFLELNIVEGGAIVYAAITEKDIVF